MVLFSVRDTGIGIPIDKLSQMFDAFTQADGSTSRKYGGTGLGLTVTKKLVQMMGGEIRAESTVSPGSKFQFTVRLRPSDKRALDEQDHDLGGHHALVVDDNETSRRFLQELLGKWGMLAVGVDSGAAALASLLQAAADDKRFSLILLDADMPDMDGFAVLQQIRRDSIIRNTRVLMLSSASSRENAARRGGAAAVSFLLKPVRKRDLLQALRTTLASEVANDVAESSPSNWLQHADDKRCAGLRILLAEDNRINQKVVIGILQKRGHTISLVGDGKEAIAALALASFDLVLMDVHMPVMDGFQAIALIRHAEVTTGIHVPVIALTANAMKGDRERCLAAGFDDYVSKPIRFLELIDAVARAAQSDSGIESGWRREPTVPLPLDWSIVLRLVGDDQQTLREICRLFVRDYAEMMQDIGQAIDRTDVAALQHAIHALIGSIGYFGSADATAAARNVDEIAHSNDLTGVRQAFLELRNILDRIVPEIKNHLAMAS